MADTTTTADHGAAIKAARSALRQARASEEAAWTAYRAAQVALEQAVEAKLPTLPGAAWSGREREQEAILGVYGRGDWMALRIERAHAKAAEVGVAAALLHERQRAFELADDADDATKRANAALQIAVAQQLGAEPALEGASPSWGCLAQAPTGEWLIGKVSTTNDYTWASAKQDNAGRWHLYACHRRRDLVIDGYIALPLKRTRPIR